MLGQLLSLFNTCNWVFMVSLSLSLSLSCTGKTDIRHDSQLGKYPFPRYWNIVPYDLGLQLHKEPIKLLMFCAWRAFYPCNKLLSLRFIHRISFQVFSGQSLSLVIYSFCSMSWKHLVQALQLNLSCVLWPSCFRQFFVQRFLCTQLKGFQVFIVASCCVSKYRLFSQRARDDCIYHKLRNSQRDAHAQINYIRRIAAGRK